MKRGDRLAELSQQIAELSLLIAFVHMRVPAADVRESDFQTNACFDQLCDLPQRVAKWRGRIVRAVLGFVLRRIHLLKIIDRFECFFACTVQRVVHGLIVNRFETALNGSRTLPGADAEVGQPARGSYTKTSDGTMNITKVRFGKKSGAGGKSGKSGGKKKSEAATQPQS